MSPDPRSVGARADALKAFATTALADVRAGAGNFDRKPRRRMVQTPAG